MKKPNSPKSTKTVRFDEAPPQYFKVKKDQFKSIPDPFNNKENLLMDRFRTSYDKDIINYMELDPEPDIPQKIPDIIPIQPIIKPTINPCACKICEHKGHNHDTIRISSTNPNITYSCNNKYLVKCPICFCAICRVCRCDHEKICIDITNTNCACRKCQSLFHDHANYRTNSNKQTLTCKKSFLVRIDGKLICNVCRYAHQSKITEEKRNQQIQQSYKKLLYIPNEPRYMCSSKYHNRINHVLSVDDYLTCVHCNSVICKDCVLVHASSHYSFSTSF